MGMTDPIADMLTRIRNASRARHQKVAVPWSRLKENIVKILIEEGYLKDQKKVKAAVGVWRGDGDPTQVRSRESADHYRHETGEHAGAAGLRRRQGVAPVRKGLGIHVLSTPKGILVDREAQKAKVGGELICSVW